MRGRAGEMLVIGYCWACALLLPGVLCCVLGFLILKGGHTLGLELIFGDTDPIDALLLRRPVFDGLFPAMVGTLSLVVLAVGLAIPVGISAGIYMAEYSRGAVKRCFSLLFDVLAGIPSIVVGLFGFSVAVFIHRHFSENIYPCLLISAVSLAFLVLPYLIRTTQVALEGVSESLRLTAPALGASRFQNIRYVLIPRALPGIISGVILSIGRCAEDTAVIMLTGVVATAGVPHTIFGGYEALPFFVYTVASQYADAQELSRGYGGAIVLLFLCGGLFFIAFGIKRRMMHRAVYRV